MSAPLVIWDGIRQYMDSKPFNRSVYLLAPLLGALSFLFAPMENGFILRVAIISSILNLIMILNLLNVIHWISKSGQKMYFIMVVSLALKILAYTIRIYGYFICKASHFLEGGELETFAFLIIIIADATLALFYLYIANIVTESELLKAKDELTLLKGIMTICPKCYKIRDKNGSWKHIVEYISTHSQVDFSHGFCPDCAEKLYPGITIKFKDRKKE